MLAWHRRVPANPWISSLANWKGNFLDLSRFSSGRIKKIPAQAGVGRESVGVNLETKFACVFDADVLAAYLDQPFFLQLAQGAVEYVRDGAQAGRQFDLGQPFAPVDGGLRVSSTRIRARRDSMVRRERSSTRPTRCCSRSARSRMIQRARPGRVSINS